MYFSVVCDWTTIFVILGSQFCSVLFFFLLSSFILTIYFTFMFFFILRFFLVWNSIFFSFLLSYLFKLFTKGDIDIRIYIPFFCFSFACFVYISCFLLILLFLLLLQYSIYGCFLYHVNISLKKTHSIKWQRSAKFTQKICLFFASLLTIFLANGAFAIEIYIIVFLFSIHSVLGTEVSGCKHTLYWIECCSRNVTTAKIYINIRKRSIFLLLLLFVIFFSIHGIFFFTTSLQVHSINISLSLFSFVRSFRIDRLFVHVWSNSSDSSA